MAAADIVDTSQVSWLFVAFFTEQEEFVAILI